MFESWGVRHPVAARLADVPPGVDLVTTLAGVDVADLDDAALLEVIAGWERVAGWVAATQALAIGELGRRARSGRAIDLIGDDIAARLATTRRAAELKVDLAVALENAPAVHDVLAAGVIDVAKARVLTTETAHLTPTDAATLHAQVLPGAATCTAPQLRAKVRGLDLAADPDAAQRRHKAERERRSVSMTPAPCSMAWLTAYLPADDAMTVMTGLDALAAASPPPDQDPRGIDARRADALVDTLRHVLDTATAPDGTPLPVRQHRRPHLQVTASATTLLGLDHAPATLHGYGPIPATMARTIAAQATWRPLLTDPHTGELLARGTTTYRPTAVTSDRPATTDRPATQRPTLTCGPATTYRPPAALAGAVIDRDTTCTFPGCRVPAHRCDLDHITAFNHDRPALGQTTANNLHTLCRHHHRLKTAGHWTPTRDYATGITTWTSTTGHTYTRDPIPTDPHHRYHHPTPPPRPTHDADTLADPLGDPAPGHAPARAHAPAHQSEQTHPGAEPPGGHAASPIEAAMRTALTRHAPPPF